MGAFGKRVKLKGIGSATHRLVMVLRSVNIQPTSVYWAVRKWALPTVKALTAQEMTIMRLRLCSSGNDNNVFAFV